MPKVSVIMPVFNCADTLGRAVQSARGQSERDIEIVIVDDCSTDGSYDVIQKLAAEDARIKHARLSQNGGASVARNTALDMAKGEWVAVLDADDWFEPRRLEKMLKAAADNNADLVCDNLKIYDHARNAVVEETHHGRRDGTTPLTAEMLFRNDNPLRRHAIGYIKPMVKSEFLRAHNIRYDPVHRNGQDFVFLAEIVLNGARGVMIPDAEYVYVHRISPTTRKISPTSRSGARFNLIVRGCDDLLQKYGATMLPEAKRALEQRRWIFESRVLCGDMVNAAREKQFGKAARIFAGRPFIGVLVATTAAKWALANLRARVRTQKIFPLPPQGGEG